MALEKYVTMIGERDLGRNVHASRSVGDVSTGSQSLTCFILSARFVARFLLLNLATRLKELLESVEGTLTEVVDDLRM